MINVINAKVRLATTTDIQRVFKALRPGRVLSRPWKWPWHVNRIGGSLLPAYYEDISRVMCEKSPSELGTPVHPCSAAAWKSLYSTLKALCLRSAHADECRWAVGWHLEALERIKVGDIYNLNGRSEVSPIDSMKDLIGLTKRASKAEVHQARCWVTILFAWAEACAFTEHTNHQECHGFYDLPTCGRWYVYSFHSLNQSLAGELSGIEVPLEEAEIVMRWEGDTQELDIFNNCLNGANDSFGHPTSAAVYMDINPPDRNSALKAVSESITRIVRWVEEQGFNTQASIFVDGWQRRFQLFTQEQSSILAGYKPVEVPGCSLVDVEDYFRKEVFV